MEEQESWWNHMMALRRLVHKCHTTFLSPLHCPKQVTWLSLATMKQRAVIPSQGGQQIVGSSYTLSYTSLP